MRYTSVVSKEIMAHMIAMRALAIQKKILIMIPLVLLVKLDLHPDMTSVIWPSLRSMWKIARFGSTQ